jgi:hypothetical protein
MPTASLIQSTAPPAPARFRWRIGLAYPAGLFCAAGVLAYFAVRVGHVRAPWLVFPLAVGAILGVIAAGLALWERFAHRRAITAAVLWASLLVVLGMHFFEYRAALEAPRPAELEVFKQAFPDMAERTSAAAPSNFLDFMRRMAQQGRAMPFGWTARGAWAWISWALDAALLAGAALAVARWATARPYCDVCQNYYRVLRQESLRRDQYQRLARLLGWPADPLGVVAYHHLSCRGACGPDLVRAVVTPTPGPPVRREAWIDYADRARLFQQLDQSA